MVAVNLGTPHFTPRKSKWEGLGDSISKGYGLGRQIKGDIEEAKLKDALKEANEAQVSEEEDSLPTFSAKRRLDDNADTLRRNIENQTGIDASIDAEGYEATNKLVAPAPELVEQLGATEKATKALPDSQKRYGLLGAYQDQPFTKEQEGMLRAQAADKALRSRGLPTRFVKEFSETQNIMRENALREYSMKIGKEFEGVDLNRNPEAFMSYANRMAWAYAQAGDVEKARKIRSDAMSETAMRGAALVSTDLAQANAYLKAVNPNIGEVTYSPPESQFEEGLVSVGGKTVPLSQFVSSIAMSHSDPDKALTYIAKDKEMKFALQKAKSELDYQKKTLAASERLARLAANAASEGQGKADGEQGVDMTSTKVIKELFTTDQEKQAALSIATLNPEIRHNPTAVIAAATTYATKPESVKLLWDRKSLGFVKGVEYGLSGEFARVQAGNPIRDPSTAGMAPDLFYTRAFQALVDEGILDSGTGGISPEITNKITDRSITQGQKQMLNHLLSVSSPISQYMINKKMLAHQAAIKAQEDKDAAAARGAVNDNPFPGVTGELGW
jgi:hypothetical protein